MTGLSDVLVALVKGTATALRSLVRARPVLQGLIVLGLASTGAALIYEPAGYIVAAGLLLLDLITDRQA